MKSYVITISRDYASLGRTIGERLAQKLKIDYYDRKLLDSAAEALGADINHVAQKEERIAAQTSLAKIMHSMGLQINAEQEKIFEVQKSQILELANQGPCVIIGRCADYILKDFSRKLRIYIYASYEDRLKNCVETLHLSPDDGKKMIASIDKGREKYYYYFTGQEYRSFRNYDLLINSSLLGVEATAELLKNCVEQKFANQ